MKFFVTNVLKGTTEADNEIDSLVIIIIIIIIIIINIIIINNINNNRPNKLEDILFDCSGRDVLLGKRSRVQFGCLLLED